MMRQGAALMVGFGLALVAIGFLRRAFALHGISDTLFGVGLMAVGVWLIVAAARRGLIR